MTQGPEVTEGCWVRNGEGLGLRRGWRQEKGLRLRWARGLEMLGGAERWEREGGRIEGLGKEFM